MTMQLDESFDADEILREEPVGEAMEEEKSDEEEVEELTLGDSDRIADLDISDEEEDNYVL